MTRRGGRSGGPAFRAIHDGRVGHLARRAVRARWLGVAAAVALAASCTNATDVELLEIDASGIVLGTVYLDLNGTGEPDAGDEPMSNVGILLTPSGGGTDVLRTGSTDTGVFVFAEVPTGSYRLSVDGGLLGDTLIATGPTEPIHVALGDTVEAVVRVSFPHLTVEEVRAAEAGRRVFVTGIALNGRANPTDGRVFLAGEESFLQAVDVERTPNIAVGDSVRLLGRTARLHDQPVLEGDGVSPRILVPQATVPIPVDLSTGDAASAQGGALDAALVRIQDAEIEETATVGGDFHVVVDDGSGPVTLVVRPFLGRTNSDLLTDGTVRVDRAVGMLSPHDDGSGTVQWRLFVRSASELVAEDVDDEAASPLRPSSD